jgi:hypothetical protein
MKLTNGLRKVILALIVVIIASTCAYGSSLGPQTESSDYKIDLTPRHSLQADELFTSEHLMENQSLRLEGFTAYDIADPQLREACICSLDEYENQLRRNAVLVASLEELLIEEWPNLDEEERFHLTASLEDLLRRQSARLDRFQSYLKRFYCLLTPSNKKKFLDSYEDLLKRQANLLLGFEDLLHLQQTIGQNSMIGFLESFEDLIRRQAKLLESFEDMLKVNCHVLKIHKYVNKCGIGPGQEVIYNYVVSNTGNYTVEGIRIIDDQLGIVARGFILGPYESRTFSKPTVLDVRCGTTVCNQARVFGVDPNGFTVSSLSNRLCIRIPCGARNQDSIDLGKQRSLAFSSDPARASNSVEIKKNQNINCSSNIDSQNEIKIKTGDQFAGAFRNAVAKNRIKIIENQAT